MIGTLWFPLVILATIAGLILGAVILAVSLLRSVRRQARLAEVQRRRAEDSLRDVPVVVITTEGAEQDRERALRLGADEYLTKPIQANRVLAVVQSLLKRD